MLANVQTAWVVQLIVFRQLRNAGFRDSAKVTWFIQSKDLPSRNVYNSAKELIVVDGSHSLRKMMLEEISAFFIMIVQLLMSHAQHASAVKVDVKKNFPQQLLLQQLLMIHQVNQKYKFILQTAFKEYLPVTNSWLQQAVSFWFM